MIKYTLTKIFGQKKSDYNSFVLFSERDLKDYRRLLALGKQRSHFKTWPLFPAFFALTMFHWHIQLARYQSLKSVNHSTNICHRPKLHCTIRTCYVLIATSKKKIHNHSAIIQPFLSTFAALCQFVILHVNICSIFFLLRMTVLQQM